MTPKFLAGVSLIAAVIAGAGCAGEPSNVVDEATPDGTAVMAPIFEVDPLWPRPLPNHWVLGSTIGVSVDSRDHVWILHRPESVQDEFKAAVFTPRIGTCCVPAPPVLEFDPAGQLVGSWGGPGDGYEWPGSNHGITVDHNDRVWIGANGMSDGQILTFTRTGEFVRQLGHAGRTGADSHDTDNFWRAAKVFVDPVENEAYVADGYGNRRIIVFDAETLEYKRHWGAYGARPDDTDLGEYDPAAPPAKQFQTVHCVTVAKDGLVYVCDRVNDRVQVFQRDGTFVREAFYAPDTLRSGSVWDIGLSRDPDETYLYIVDGVNEQIRVVLRDTLEVLTTFGDGGRQPGQFFGVHNIATDSMGNVYTTETYTGARVQRFLYRGLGPVSETDQGVPWPR